MYIYGIVWMFVVRDRQTDRQTDRGRDTDRQTDDAETSR